MHALVSSHMQIFTLDVLVFRPDQQTTLKWLKIHGFQTK